jgi:prepilin-type N-terminal cleavage/methylation domain-containing protein
MNKRGAFSLIEMLVAVAVFALLLTILAGSYSGIERAISQTNARREANATGRAALEWITRDLERIRPPTPGFIWSVTQNTNTNRPVATLGSQFLIASDQIATNTLNPHAAFWQVANEEGAGRTMAIVGYFVRWITETNNGASTKRPVLCRLYLNQTNAAYPASLNTANGTWLDDNLLTNAPGDAAGSYRGWFADNVHSIWFRALDANGAPISSNASSTNFTNGSFDSRQGYLSGTNRIMGPALPSSVEVAVIVMNPQRLQGNTATYPVLSGLGSNPANFWSDIQSAMNDTSIPPQIRESLRLYSTRVPISYAK